LALNMKANSNYIPNCIASRPQGSRFLDLAVKRYEVKYLKQNVPLSLPFFLEANTVSVKMS